MLNYLVTSTEQLLYMSLILGLIYGYVRIAFAGVGKKTVRVGFIAGVGLAVVMTCFKLKTSMVDTAMWNVRIFTVSMISLAAFLIGTALGKRMKRVKAIVPILSMAVMAATLLLYFLPDFMENPNTILLAESTVMSSAFILKLLGAIFGLIIALVAGIAVFKACAHVKPRLVFLLLVIVLLLNTFKQIGTIFGVLLARRIILSNHMMFMISKFVSNYDHMFIFLAVIISLVIPVLLLIRSAHINEPYKNNAQRRKILAKWKNIRKWSCTSIICAVGSVLILTALFAYVNQEVELSPIEEATAVDDENVYVDFDLVNDGHLHRFGYETEDGTVIRFIVIQKPDSAAYGIGLDACDICGETGYYEKDGQVVCNLCDVVMNINTIGFKGGCNPIVIDYSLENGQIVVPIEGLLEYESEFE